MNVNSLVSTTTNDALKREKELQSFNLLFKENFSFLLEKYSLDELRELQISLDESTKKNSKVLYSLKELKGSKKETDTKTMHKLNELNLNCNKEYRYVKNIMKDFNPVYKYTSSFKS